MEINTIIFITQQTFLKTLSIIFSDSRTSPLIVIRNDSSITIRATRASYINIGMSGNQKTNDTRQKPPIAIAMSERARNSQKSDMVRRISNIEYRLFDFRISNIEYSKFEYRIFEYRISKRRFLSGIFAVFDTQYSI